jgi:hypothetical protein
MIPRNPGDLLDPDLQHKSVFRVLRANISIGQADTFDSAGNPATFTQDNGDGIMIRVGSNANPFGLSNSWAGTNVNTTIVHNLGRVPIGYFITKKTGACDVYDGSIVATKSNITLKTTDGTQDTVIYIF